ncbi:MAG: NUDIX domain-containing protein [Candidatus Aenigmatarchaeota archaeon]
MPSMEKMHYVVATGIIIRDGKFLIVKRAPHEIAFPNRWTVPGGKLEPKDYSNREKDTPYHWFGVLERLLEREAMEEVGLEISNIRYLTNLAFIRPDGVSSLVISLFADHKGGDVKLCKDLTEHAWVTAEEAKRYDLIEGIREQIEEVNRLIR